MNHVEIILRLYHCDASPKILEKWFRVYFVDLMQEDEIYYPRCNYSCNNDTKSKSCVLFVKLFFDTPLPFEELIEYINLLVEFDNSKIYTIRKNEVSLELFEDKVIYNKEEFYLNDLTIRDSRTHERLNKLKHTWNQI